MYDDDMSELLSGIWFVVKVAAAIVLSAAALGLVIRVLLWAAGLGA